MDSVDNPGPPFILPPAGRFTLNILNSLGSIQQQQPVRHSLANIRTIPINCLYAGCLPCLFYFSFTVYINFQHKMKNLPREIDDDDPQDRQKN